MLSVSNSGPTSSSNPSPASSSSTTTRRNSTSQHQHQHPCSPPGPGSSQSSSSGYSSSSSRSNRLADPTLSNSGWSSNNTSPPAGFGSATSRAADSDFNFTYSSTTNSIHRHPQFNSSKDSSLSPPISKRDINQQSPVFTRSYSHSSSPSSPSSVTSPNRFQQDSFQSPSSMSMNRTASVPVANSHPNHSSATHGNASREEWQKQSSVGAASAQGGERSISGWDQSLSSAPPNRSPVPKTRKMSEGGSRQQGSSGSHSRTTGQGAAAQEGAQYRNEKSGLPSSSSNGSTRPLQGESSGSLEPSVSSTSINGSDSATLTTTGSTEPANSTQARGTESSPRREATLNDSSSSNKSSSHRNRSLSPQSSQKAPADRSGHVQYASSSYSGLDSSSSSSPEKGSSFRSPDSNRNTSSLGPEAQIQDAPETPHLDLASYPTQDLLRVLATLLHQIATANDELRPTGASSGSGLDDRNNRGRSKEKSRDAPGSEGVTGGGSAMSRNGSSANNASGSRALRRSPASATTAALGALSTPSSTLCFHARNVPSISIESYLVRILKYCPTTNEVFLSLLVYFDRMSRMSTGASPGRSSSGGDRPGRAAGLPDGRSSGSGPSDEDGDTRMRSGSEERRDREQMELDEDEDDEGQEPHPGMRGFAIDSYNVHRLVIAGVTVASKFFSDVFYTNSRYAKVSDRRREGARDIEVVLGKHRLCRAANVCRPTDCAPNHQHFHLLLWAYFLFPLSCSIRGTQGWRSASP